MNFLFAFIAALTLSFAQANYCILSGGRYSIVSVSSGNYLYGNPYWHVIKLNNGKYALKSVSSGNYLQMMPDVAASAVLGSKGIDISDANDIINVQWRFIATKNDIDADCTIVRIRSESSEFYLSEASEASDISNKEWKLVNVGIIKQARHSLLETGATTSSVPSYVAEFAPKWMFMNSNGAGYPMNPQIFYQFMISPEPASTTLTNAAGGNYYEWSKQDGNVYLENNDFDAIYDGLVPTLYAINRCASGRIHILYYIAYGFQHSCTTCAGEGSHQGGFEWVSIVLNEDATDIFGVYFKQHSGHYFKTKNEVNFDGSHAKVYVGKYAHGTYHYSQPNEASIDALYWEDPRNGDKQWIPNIHQLYIYDITNIHNDNYEAPMWNGLAMEWMQVKSEDEFPASAHESKQIYGKDFFTKIGKLTYNVCDIDPCKGQDLVGTEGCAKCSCFDADKYTDSTKSNPFRCREGRDTYGRHNQPFEI